MTKLKFGAWIPTYAWSGVKSDSKNVKRIRASIEKCEDHRIDVWVVDHLLTAPGLYGNAWLEPLNALAFAAALTRKVKIATGWGAQVLRLLILAIAAIFRPKALLIAENLCLRQQLAVLQRRHPRARLSDADRRFWILASRWFSDWQHPLLL